MPTMHDNIIPKKPIIPVNPTAKNGHANNSPSATYRPKLASPSYHSSTTVRSTSTTTNPHNVILAAHPQDNEIAGSVNIR